MSVLAGIPRPASVPKHCLDLAAALHPERHAICSVILPFKVDPNAEHAASHPDLIDILSLDQHVARREKRTARIDEDLAG
jgi:hypothetical protein